MPEIVFHAVPLWLLNAYLAELGGAQDQNGIVRGTGWTAKVAADKVRLTSLEIGRVTVTLEGPAAEEIIVSLDKKAQRAGG